MPALSGKSPVALAIALGGCATVDPTPDYEWARDEVAAATGEDGLFQPGEEERVAARIEQFLDDGLTAQESVQVSLLNNRELQSQKSDDVMLQRRQKQRRVLYGLHQFQILQYLHHLGFGHGLRNDARTDLLHPLAR